MDGESAGLAGRKVGDGAEEGPAGGRGVQSSWWREDPRAHPGGNRAIPDPTQTPTHRNVTDTLLLGHTSVACGLSG